MFKHSLVWIFLVPLSMVWFLGAQSAPAPELPAGSMRAPATTACTECHDTRIIVQQRLSNAAWTKEVDKMTKWGAVVDPQDRDALIHYLSANFSVDKPEYVADRLPVAHRTRPKK